MQRRYRTGVWCGFGGVKIELNQIYNIDCLEGMRQIQAGTVDMVLCDLPYGVTAKNKWDSIIDPAALWEQYERIVKPSGAILLFGQDKFTARMMNSNLAMHRYNLIWKKVLPSGFLNANRQPLREHEDIMVFYKKPCTYNPQKVKGTPCHSKGKAVGKSNDEILNNHNYRDFVVVETDGDMKFPTSIWEFQKPHPSVAVHPTEKPVELCQCAIRTYSNAGDTVLDNCCGAGSTMIAAMLEDRNYIGMDNGFCEKKNSRFFEMTWADVSKIRIEEAKVGIGKYA